MVIWRSLGQREVDGHRSGPGLYRCGARPDQVEQLVPPQVGRVEPERDGWCVLVAGGDDLDWLAMHIARLGFEAEVLEPPDLCQAAALLAHRLAAMAGPN
jgi:predicted DNA-binding transcriptional regulator YafY